MDREKEGEEDIGARSVLDALVSCILAAMWGIVIFTNCGHKVYFRAKSTAIILLDL